MERKLHLLDSFVTKGSDGGTYKVHGYEHLVRDEATVDGVEHWEPTGVFEYRLAEGGRIDVEADGTMRIASSGVSLATPDKAKTRATSK